MPWSEQKIHLWISLTRFSTMAFHRANRQTSRNKSTTDTKQSFLSSPGGKEWERELSLFPFPWWIPVEDLSCDVRGVLHRVACPPPYLCFCISGTSVLSCRLVSVVTSGCMPRMNLRHLLRKAWNLCVGLCCSPCHKTIEQNRIYIDVKDSDHVLKGDGFGGLC